MSWEIKNLPWPAFYFPGHGEREPGNQESELIPAWHDRVSVGLPAIGHPRFADALEAKTWALENVARPGDIIAQVRSDGPVSKISRITHVHTKIEPGPKGRSLQIGLTSRQRLEPCSRSLRIDPAAARNSSVVIFRFTDGKGHYGLVPDQEAALRQSALRLRPRLYSLSGNNCAMLQAKLFRSIGIDLSGEPTTDAAGSRYRREATLDHLVGPEDLFRGKSILEPILLVRQDGSFVTKDLNELVKPLLPAPRTRWRGALTTLDRSITQAPILKPVARAFETIVSLMGAGVMAWGHARTGMARALHSVMRTVGKNPRP